MAYSSGSTVTKRQGMRTYVSQYSNYSIFIAVLGYDTFIPINAKIGFYMHDVHIHGV